MAEAPKAPEQPAPRPTSRLPFGLNSDRRHILYAILAAIVVPKVSDR